MFHAKLSDGLLLKRLIESLRELVHEVNLDVQSTGLTVQAMDASHIALVALRLSSDGFEEFRCDKAMALGVALPSLAKVLRVCETGDSVTLDCEEKNREKLRVGFENGSKYIYIYNIYI